MFPNIRYLLLQVRNPDDPMKQSEVRCFARVLQADLTQIQTADFIRESIDNARLQQADVVLLGGSGHYSVAKGGDWLHRALETLRRVRDLRIPTFASCWGFQAISEAFGGKVVNDLSRAEIGTHTIFLTAAGKSDPVFGPLGETFAGQMGHEDIVDQLPGDAVLLASTELVTNQAFRFDDAPIYCTQFHPELNYEDLLQRVMVYPEYIERIAKMPPERFQELIYESVETEAILVRFVKQMMA